MSIYQLNFDGLDKIEVAIKRLQTFEPPEGYYLAFSGGKDSVCIERLAKLAGVKYNSFYHCHGLDPPELVRFIRQNYPDVTFTYPKMPDGSRATIIKLMEKNGFPPTRIMRYCCKYFKEGFGEGHFVITGVRRAESVRRAKRGGLELSEKKTTARKNLDPDNLTQNLVDSCPAMARRVLNPIIDWSDFEVWEFIKRQHIPYCCLYDEGFKRLGCIGCPYAKNKILEFERWPGYKNIWLLGFKRMLKARESKNNGKKTNWKTVDWETAEEVMKWYLETDKKKKRNSVKAQSLTLQLPNTAALLTDKQAETELFE